MLTIFHNGDRNDEPSATESCSLCADVAATLYWDDASGVLCSSCMPRHTHHRSTVKTFQRHARIAIGIAMKCTTWSSEALG